jgi:adenine-specific DNA-methyltransferase
MSDANEFEIRCCDVLDGLKSLPAGSVPLVVTSPPYNIGKSYESVRPLEDYLDWCEQWLAEIFRVTAENGSFWLNLGYVEVPGAGKAVPLAYMLWNRSEFHLLQEVVWNYGAGVACKRMFSPRNEKWLWFVKNEAEYVFNLDDVRDPDVKYPKQKKNGKLKCNPLGKNPTDVWQIPKVTSGEGRASKERTDHPAQFPVKLVERVVRACSNEGDLVLDPFAGSGSSGVAAVGNDRRYLGFDIRADYCDLADSRVHRAAVERKSFLFT